MTAIEKKKYAFYIEEHYIHKFVYFAKYFRNWVSFDVAVPIIKKLFSYEWWMNVNYLLSGELFFYNEFKQKI